LLQALESSVQEFNSGGAFLFLAAGITDALQGCLSSVKESSYIEGRFSLSNRGCSGCFPGMGKLLTGKRN